MANRLEEGVCILCGFQLLEGTNASKDIAGLCEECVAKFKEKVEAMKKNPSMRTKGWKFVQNMKDLPEKLRKRAEAQKGE